MKSMIYKIVLLAAFISNISLLYSQNGPKREFRGAWFPTVVNTTWKNMTSEQIKNDIIYYLDIFKSLNINAVIFQVRPQADALFLSDIEPWSRFITGTQGRAPEPFFDPTLFVIEECHKRGIEMHAWLNPYRVTSNENEVLSEGHLFFNQPELFVQYGTQLYFDPGQPGSRSHTVKVVADLVRRYDVDAVHFDDYFYPYKLPYLEFPDEESFIKYHKKDGFGRYQKNDWRRNNVNKLVKELSDTIKKIKPWVKFGISPFGVWRNKDTDPNGSESSALQTNYDDLYADILLWTKNGWIDYNVPQLYWEIGHSRVNYESLIAWWTKNNYDAHLYIGQSLSSTLEIKMKNGNVENQLYKKMRLVRENSNINGNVWWSGLGFAEQKQLSDSLRSNYQKNLALMPIFKNIDSVAPKPVINLKIKKGMLTWMTNKELDVMNAPFYFGIYCFEKDEKIDISNPSKLIDIVHENSYRLRSKKGVRYVVTALDRMQNESTPCMVVY